MSNPEKTSNATFKNMRIGVAERGGFLIKTLVENDGVSVEQTVVIDGKQAEFIRDFIAVHMPEADSEPTLPEEPEEAGWYFTQSGELLCKDTDDDWCRFSECGDNLSWLTADGKLIGYTYHWDDVLRTLDTSEFPLVHISKEERAQYVQSITAVTRGVL